MRLDLLTQIHLSLAGNNCAVLSVPFIRSLCFVDLAARDESWVIASKLNPKLHDLLARLERISERIGKQFDEQIVQIVQATATEIEQLVKDSTDQKAAEMLSQARDGKRYERDTQKWLQSLNDYEPHAFDHFVFATFQSLRLNIVTNAY